MNNVSVLTGRSPRIAQVLYASAGLIVFSSCIGPVRAAQGADAPTASFEVASIKPSGRVDPGRARRLEFMENEYPRGLFSVRGGRVEAFGDTAAQLVAAAYLIPVREIAGPTWMSDARFDIVALIPSGQSPNQATEMLRTLLEKRFSLKAHHEVRRMFGYILSIGKGGTKLTETGPPAPTNKSGDYVKRIKPGFNGTQMDHCDMPALTKTLAQSLNAPVEDQTGLKGHYSIVLQYLYSEWADESARPEILRDILRDYGLNLTAGKVDAPFLVIDNFSRTPAEN